MRLMADVTVTVTSNGRDYIDTVRMEFEDEDYTEFDFGGFFRDLVNKLKPVVVEALPKERIVIDIKNIRRSMVDREKLEEAYVKCER
ncbi:hypothetical protein SAMN02745221_00042 [Thermosyntropha lipolytica DSM 11003]|uniref:Uncharacterized protein n=1 Tax=Thermosyntropha lipolytica DSM 11003 TaxID=1123382 RepID=A0A1M5JCH3_9FIRM|nr:hypothetical protein [Thermosyntropha lipolytica]SHG37693.1 hypothetical protein SAMN02745221_00042 [Thermosyntropha lipolytica DSM 11003]